MGHCNNLNRCFSETFLLLLLPHEAGWLQVVMFIKPALSMFTLGWTSVADCCCI
jgi:hypothetical protein